MNAEVRPGYQLTDVGVIPQDWEVKRLRDISPSQTVGLVINPSSYFDEAGTIPMLVGSHVSENSISWQTANKITEKSNNQISASRLYANDLVMVRVGEPGVTAVVPPDLDGCNCASMMIIRQGRAFDSTWLCYVMNSDIGRKQVENVQYGTAQKQFNISDAVNFVYPTPPFAEQKAIASALLDVDSVITNLDQLVAKKRDIQQAAMQQLLTGQRRLPGFSGDWEVGRLGDFGRCLRGVSYKGDADLFPYDNDETYRLLRSNNVQQSAIVTYGLQFVNARCVSDHQILKPDDILICMANGSKELVGKAGLFKVSDGHEYTFGAFMGCFRIAANAVPNFIFALFGTHKFKSYIANLLAGSSINNLRPCDIEQMEFSFPLKSEQTAIATILSDMDSELTALEVRRDKARQLKQGMMQELLTGRIRLV